MTASTRRRTLGHPLLVLVTVMYVLALAGVLVLMVLAAGGAV